MTDFETTCTLHGAITNYFCPTCKAECDAELAASMPTTGGTVSTTTSDNPCSQSGQLAPVFSYQGAPMIRCSACDRRFLVDGFQSVKRFPTHWTNDGEASHPAS